jgi:N-acetylneuraminic acid mutarotase
MFWDRAQSSVVSNGHNLYVLGGRNETVDAVVGNFNSASGQWQEAIHMALPEPVYAAGVALVGEHLVLVGGCVQRASAAQGDRAREAVSSRVYSYPVDTAPQLSGGNMVYQRCWFKMRPLGVARGRHGCAVIQGTVYALGGVDENGQVLASVEMLDQQEAKWVSVAPMPAARRDFGCVVANSRIVVVGGADVPVGQRSGKCCVATVFVYDAKSNSWAELPPLRHPRQGLACSMLGGKLYAIGGSDVDDVATVRERLAQVERYDFDLQQWQEVSPLTMPRSHLGAGVVQYLGGGGVPGRL